MDVIISVFVTFLELITLAYFWFFWVLLGLGCIMAGVSLGLTWPLYLGGGLILAGAFGAWKAATDER